MYSKNERLYTLINDYLHTGKLLHLASSLNNTLWMCHVWYAMGESPQELIFTSNKSRRHSKEIKNNPIVAGGVNTMNLEGLGQKVQGLSFEGLAEEAVGEKMKSAYSFYAKRWPQVRTMFTSDDIEFSRVDMRMFRVKITRVVLFDEVNYPSNPRQEILY
jgi:uncharacterized protein YhbP (UPF0306 family)